MAKSKNWISGAVKKPGALHKSLGVPKGEKIPAAKLKSAAAKGGKEGKRARSCRNVQGLRAQEEEMTAPIIIGDATLYLGDCLDILPTLPTLPKVGAVITDPPYGMGDILDRTPSDATRWSKHFGAGAPKWDAATCDEAISVRCR